MFFFELYPNFNCYYYKITIMSKNIYNKKRIDTSKYVNIETGETLHSEIPTLTSVNIKNNDMVIISSHEYMTIDSEALRYIRSEFNNAECARILDMCDMINGPYNLLYNKENKLHTKETLGEELNYTVNKFRDFLSKLYKKSIIYYLSGFKDGKEQIGIMLNPTLARKQKTYNVKCVNSFQNLSKSSKIN